MNIISGLTKNIIIINGCSSGTEVGIQFRRTKFYYNLTKKKLNFESITYIKNYMINPKLIL
jgi:hypothetical protein